MDERSQRVKKRDDLRVRLMFSGVDLGLWEPESGALPTYADLVERTLPAKAAERRDLRRKAGVYFLLLRDEVVYIGQSVGVRARVTQHRGGGIIDFDDWRWMLCPEPLLLRLEEAHIKAWLPKHNMNPSAVWLRSKAASAALPDTQPAAAPL